MRALQKLVEPQPKQQTVVKQQSSPVAAAPVASSAAASAAAASSSAAAAAAASSGSSSSSASSASSGKDGFQNIFASSGRVSLEQQVDSNHGSSSSLTTRKADHFKLQAMQAPSKCMCAVGPRAFAGIEWRAMHSAQQSHSVVSA